MSERTATRPRLTRHLVKGGLLPSDLMVVDVGVSTGYQRVWRHFGDRWSLHGFDPLVREIERLRADETSPKIHYVDAFVTGHQPRGEAPHGDGLHGRLSAHRVRRLIEYDPVREHFNRGEEVVLSERHVTLDDYFAPERHDEIDVIKVDTDGSDYAVLEGASRILERRMVLGAHVEVRFTGEQRDDANLFRNVDRILGQSGLSIFHLDTRRYSRAALPMPFVKDKPSGTVRGQIRWGNALYLRDLGAASYEETWGRTYPLDKILKLICLFEIFGLPDCAVEVVDKYADRLAEVIPPAKLRNWLTPDVAGKRMSYRDYDRSFETMVRARRFFDFGRVVDD